MKEVYPVFECSGSMGQYSRLVCIFNDKQQAEDFCKSCNTPSHTKYTGSYMQVRTSKMFYEIEDAIKSANNNEIRI